MPGSVLLPARGCVGVCGCVRVCYTFTQAGSLAWCRSSAFRSLLSCLSEDFQAVRLYGSSVHKTLAAYWAPVSWSIRLPKLFITAPLLVHPCVLKEASPA